MCVCAESEVTPAQAVIPAPCVCEKHCTLQLAARHDTFRKTREGWNCRFQKNTPHGRWGQGPGSVDPRFPAGLPFPVPEILVFVAFGDSGKFFSSNFPGIFPKLSSRTPAKTPETATAFSSFLSKVIFYIQNFSQINYVIMLCPMVYSCCCCIFLLDGGWHLPRCWRRECLRAMSSSHSWLWHREPRGVHHHIMQAQMSIMCKNGRGRFGGQTAGGHAKASPRPRQPLFAVLAWRELESACRASLL